MIFDAVILAGGRSSRLGGHPKSQLVFEGSTLLQRTLDAVRDARQIVIVGDPHTTLVSATTIVTRENPPFGGPAAALAAALDATTGIAADWVLVLACDMPFAARAVPVLLSRLEEDAVLAIDDSGRQQYLLACYRRSALHDVSQAHADSVAGMSMRALVAELATTLVVVPAGSSTDIDTWEDAIKLEISPEYGGFHG